MFERRNAKKVQKFISPHIDVVHDAYGMGGDLKYEKPVSHDTVVLMATVLATHEKLEKLLAEQQGALASILKAMDAQGKPLREQTDLLRQILQSRSGR